MSVLALDLGEKRVGVAISSSKIVARPLITLDFNNNFFSQLNDICRREKIKRIIIGLPKSLSGKKNDQEKRIRKIAEEIKAKTNLPIKLIDESFTSKIAEERRAKDVDQEAAAIILQDYLDKEAEIGRN